MRAESSGKSWLMMSKSSSRETALNMLVRSTKIAALDGESSLDWGETMNFSMESCMLLMMKSIPFGTPTAKLYGRRWSANLSFQCWAICVAMIRLIAVGIPMGLSFRSSSGSL